MSSTATTPATLIFSQDDISRTLKRLAHEVIEANQGAKNIVLMGILTRGKYLAERLAILIQELEAQDLAGASVPQGTLDITLYRDDADRTFKSVQRSDIPTDMTGKHVILVDDVIFSGRSIRAALDALNDYGRPASVQLLVLLDRGHRELPIHPNFVGKNVPTAKSERVNVRLMESDGEEFVSLVKPQA